MQCVAALSTLCLFVGWLLPTFCALRRRHQAALRRPATLAPAGADNPADGFDPPAQSRWNMGADRMAAWVMENVFLAGAPHELSLLAWWVLAGFSWMAGGLIALLLPSAGQGQP